MQRIYASALFALALIGITVSAAWALTPQQRVLLVGGKHSSPTPPIQGSLVLEDGTSFLLLEDGTSHLCLEGGC